MKGLSYTIGIIAVAVIVVAVLAVMLILPAQRITGPSTAGSTAPTLATQTAEASSTAAESSASGFVNDATPTPDQVVPDVR